MTARRSPAINRETLVPCASPHQDAFRDQTIGTAEELHCEIDKYRYGLRKHKRSNQTPIR